MSDLRPADYRRALALALHYINDDGAGCDAVLDEIGGDGAAGTAFMRALCRAFDGAAAALLTPAGVNCLQVELLGRCTDPRFGAASRAAAAFALAEATGDDTQLNSALAAVDRADARAVIAAIAATYTNLIPLLCAGIGQRGMQEELHRYAAEENR